MVLKKVGITGSSGMIGMHVLAKFAQSGIPSISTSRRRPSDIPQNSTWFKWDIAQWKKPEELDECFPEVQALLHLAAHIPDRTSMAFSTRAIFDANVRACLCLGTWALMRNIPLVYISSAAVYAEPERRGIKESDAKALRGMGGFYGLSKLMGENILQFLAGEGLKVCILRPSSLYGNGLPEDKIIPKFLLRASRGEVIELAPPVNNKVDLVHADDLVHAILHALEREAWGIYNIGGERVYSIEEIARKCVSVVGRGEVRVPVDELSVEAEVRFALDCTAARDAFGYEPLVDLAEGLRRTWSGMQSNMLSRETK